MLVTIEQNNMYRTREIMKTFIVVVLLAVICAVTKTEDVCHNHVIRACSGDSYSGSICSSRNGGINHIEPEVQAYINSHFIKSFEYLLMATYFNSREKNRPGFQRLYQGLSDRSFDDGIEIIKQLSRRGGKLDLNVIHESPARLEKKLINLETDELHSLAIALDTEKELFNGAIHIHTRSLHASERDPEMAQYIEENFLSKQAETVRKLSGYTNDLAKMMNHSDPSLAVYYFDEYLRKQ
ncbi:soma ferritin-like [Lucilia cuprina]|uniref:soma ferritin-like n=1 Tax=Lucilia cuprina TaxID=7375 RepID=UPI001F06B3A2|nr:soma ferritin-like [Lucilia cuprina]